jgi:hypothetical protein
VVWQRRPFAIEPHYRRRLILRLARFFSSSARPSHVYVVAAILGIATYVVVYGAGHAIGASAYWTRPQADEGMALGGYRYFLLGDWHWPVFASDAVNVPYTRSVAFLDCIPLWALVNKAVATILPAWREVSLDAYLGLWHALTFALQAVFGVALVRALGHRSWFAALVAMAMLLSVPTWIFRYAHPALSAHWIELWALVLYVRTPAGIPTSRRHILGLLALLAVGTLVTPYHPVLCFPVFVAALCRSRDARTIVVGTLCGLATIAIAGWFAGYFAAEATRAQWGFEAESANALSWLVPLRSGLFGDAHWAVADATGFQYEGYAYLGVGYLALVAWFVPRAATLAVLRRHRVLAAVCVAFSLVALSNHIYVGSHEIASYAIPSMLSWIPSQFRSPGRFVWIPTYVLIAFLLHQALTRATTRRTVAMLVVIVGLQVVDATGNWAWQRHTTEAPAPVLADQQTWRERVHAHRAVTILPPYSCVLAPDAEILDVVSREIQLLASERALPINGTYATRARRKCKREAEAWPTLEPQPSTLYIVLPEASVAADRLRARGVPCEPFAYGQFCSTP